MSTCRKSWKTVRIDIVTLFPAMFEAVFGESIIKRAREKGLLDIRLTQLRDFAFDKHRQVDDSPFGGGSGMVLKPEPMFRAVRSIVANSALRRRRIVLLCPSGETFTQAKAKELAKEEQLIFLSGHYEGFDARMSSARRSLRRRILSTMASWSSRSTQGRASSREWKCPRYFCPAIMRRFAPGVARNRCASRARGDPSF